MKKYQFVKFLSIAVLACLLAACASSQQRYTEDYAQAHDDFAAHRYIAAFHEIQVPARAGNPDAQYALGYMYYYGKGTYINEGLAKYWFQQAAAQGQPAARKALAKIR